METRWKVLRQLRGKPGCYVSGQGIAEAAGVSRNAVWKAVRALRRQGYQIEGCPHRGYRLQATPDLPLAAEVLAGLAGDSFPYRVEYLPEVSSTNDVARDRGRAGEPEGLVVVAERQLAGRGRRGRSWDSPPGVGLWFSLLLRPPLLPREVSLLGLLAAVAGRTAVEEACGASLLIKWPNDLVLAEERKVAGVLVEMEGDLDQVHHVVVGVGINVGQAVEDFPPELREQAASVRLAAGRPVSRVTLFQEYLRAFAALYRGAITAGFDTVLEEARRHSATLGRSVWVVESRGAWRGVACALAGDGSLLVRPDGGGALRPVYAADVSIRTSPPPPRQRSPASLQGRTPAGE